MRRRKKKKMQKKKVAGEDETGLLDEASLSLTAAEEIPFLTSISSRDKIRSLPPFFSLLSVATPTCLVCHNPGLPEL